MPRPFLPHHLYSWWENSRSHTYPKMGGENMLPWMRNALGKRHRMFASTKNKTELPLRKMKTDFWKMNLGVLTHGTWSASSHRIGPISWKTGNKKIRELRTSCAPVTRTEISKLNWLDVSHVWGSVWFPPKPLVVGSLKSTLCLCPQTVLCFAGHRRLLVWSGRPVFAQL